MSFTTDDYRRAVYIVEEASELLNEALRREARGFGGIHPRILLTGMVLTMTATGSAKISDIHHTLTHQLPLELQWELGVRYGDPENPRVLQRSQLYQLSKRITKKLDFSEARASDLPAAERQWRHRRLQDIIDASLRATLIPRPEGSYDYALDGTGLWAFETAPRRIPDAPAQTSEDKWEQDEAIVADLKSHRGAPAKTGRGAKGASDADWGSKTHKNGGRQVYYGYDVEALARVPALGRGQASEPCLVEALRILPGGPDIVEPSLEMIDGLLAAGVRVDQLIVDRHYSYKAFSRWLLPLMQRGVDQIADAHPNDQGFKDWDGVKFAAAHTHCPLTPDRLGDLHAPPPGVIDEQRQAAFYADIDEREQYAAQLVQRLNTHGRIKARCPARNGTLGCPLVAGTVAAAAELGLPTVNPPEDFQPTKLCTQDTVTFVVSTDEQRKAVKLAGPYYVGGKRWRKAFDRRTFIESWFGVLKSSASTGLDRESHNFRGLPMVCLVVAVAAAVTNMQLLRSWHADTGLGDLTHPLLQPDEQFHGFTQVSAETAVQIGRDHLDGNGVRVDIPAPPQAPAKARRGKVA